MEHKNYDSHYWDGSKNRFIRYYFYMQRGLALMNEFRYLVMAVFALYLTLKLDNPVLLLVMFLVACPGLVVVGYIAVHHIMKVIEYLNVQYTTHFSRYSIELQEKRNRTLEEINGKLDKNSKDS